MDAISAIRSFVSGVTANAYLRDRKTQSAVERELLTVAEACGKLLDMDENIEHRFPEVPWRAVRGIGNILRHEYGRVDGRLVWDTIEGAELEHLAQALTALQET